MSTEESKEEQAPKPTKSAAKKAAAKRASTRASAPQPSNQDQVADTNSMTLEAIDAEIAQIELETKRLTLRKLKKEILKFNADELSAEQRAQAAQDALNAERAGQEAKESICAHRVGGFGLEDTYSGRGEPSLIMSELPIAGQKMIICYRCGGDWRTPDPNLRRTAPAAYLQQLNGWKDMLKMCRESVQRPVGGPIFAFEKDGIPHHPVIR